MAKRNSTKTASKEARQASEPRLVQLRGWKGMSLQNKTLGWNADSAEHSPTETDLQSTFLMVQDNVNTTYSGCLETRNRTLKLTSKPDGLEADFTGVEYLFGNNLFCAFSDGSLWVYDISSVSPEDLVKGNLSNDGWKPIDVCIASFSGHYVTSSQKVDWTSIRVISIGGEKKLLCFGTVTNFDETTKKKTTTSVSYLGNYVYDKTYEVNRYVVKASKLKDPTEDLIPKGAFVWQPRGDVCTKLSSDDVDTVASRIRFYFAYTNDWGSTEACKVRQLNENDYDVGQAYVYKSFTEWDSENCIVLSGEVPRSVASYYDSYGTCRVSGVDIYYSVGDNTNTAFLGHADVANGKWSHVWLGAYSDTSEWSSYNTNIPDGNTTGGIDACFSIQIDGRNYFWGSPEVPERLWIGGNAPNELSVARGLGGAYVDIEPGIGTVVKAVHKFKTQSGASIVTILCSNNNTGRTKRYNLIETNITVTSSLSEQTYMVEEVSNVIGCSSFWGSGVFVDGMYSLGRYGLTVTTQQMEYSSQLRSTVVSSAIDPVFSDRLAEQIENARVICINEIIYLCLAEGEGDLSKVIFCYDTSVKTWYTYSLPITDDEPILHIFALDYHRYIEGIGIVLPSRILVIPTAGYEADTDLYRINDGNFKAYLETGEIGASMPPQALVHVCQLEFAFDYIIGWLDVDFDAIDYYGRHVHVHKLIGSAHLAHSFSEWMRIDYKVTSFNLRISGNAHFKLTSVFLKEYTNSRKVNLVYGFNSDNSYIKRRGGTSYQHHAVDNYNNLKACILP